MIRGDELLGLIRLSNGGMVRRWNDLHFAAGIFGALAFIVAESAALCLTVFGHTAVYSPSFNHILTNFVFEPSALFFTILTITSYIRWRSARRLVNAIACTSMTAALVFVFYFLHSAWRSADTSLVIPLITTIGYGSPLLTSCTGVVSLVFKSMVDTSPISGGSLALISQFFSANLMFIIVWTICILFIYAEKQRQEELDRGASDRDKMFLRMVTDTLTGIGNRLALRHAFDQMAHSADKQYIAAMVDMDKFKGINDTLGHQIGDEYIKTTASLLDSVPSANAYRYGGDEFCLIFHGWEMDQARQQCQELIEAMVESEVCQREKVMTLSFGLAQWDGIISPAALLRKADEALYKAKETRGIVVTYEPEIEFGKSKRRTGE